MASRGTRLEILISRPKRQSYVDFGDKSQIPGGGEESPNMWPIIKMKIEDIRSFDNPFEVNWPPESTLVLHWISKFFSLWRTSY